MVAEGWRAVAEEEVVVIVGVRVGVLVRVVEVLVVRAATEPIVLEDQTVFSHSWVQRAVV